MRPIHTEDDLIRGLAELLKTDPRLKPVSQTAGSLPLRRRAADFEGLVHIVIGQQVSVASASAIFARLQKLVEPLTAENVSSFSDDDIAGAGLSRPKIRTLRAISTACVDGLDLSGLAAAPAEKAHSRLCEIKGIGRWTADIFLLFCAGHPDIFPSGDLALQIAVGEVFGMPDKPDVKTLDRIAADWAPNRGIAARLFWAWYRVQKQGKDTFPV